MTSALLWVQFAAAAAIILVASTYMARSADVIAFKTGLGRSFVGVVLLATATSLPELGLGVSSVAWLDQPDLAAGDAFGSNLFNLLIIGLLDLFWRRGPILNSVGMTPALIGALGMVVIALAAIGVIVHSITTEPSTAYISPVSVLLVIAGIGAMYMIYRFDSGQDQGADDAEPEHEYGSASTTGAVFMYALSAGVVVGSAIWLAFTGDGLAEQMGWEASLVGTQFLALSTSLPELAASFAAIRINAPELAISNVLGSNLFNMGFVLFLDDVVLTDGVFWSAIDSIHALTAMLAIIMTAVVLIALMSRGRERPSRFWTLESVTLIGLYVSASVLVFALA